MKIQIGDIFAIEAYSVNYDTPHLHGFFFAEVTERKDDENYTLRAEFANGEDCFITVSSGELLIPHKSFRKSSRLEEAEYYVEYYDNLMDYYSQPKTRDFDLVNTYTWEQAKWIGIRGSLKEENE